MARHLVDEFSNMSRLMGNGMRHKHLIHFYGVYLSPSYEDRGMSVINNDMETGNLNLV